MAQFIKVKQKDDVELLINTNIIETIFPDKTVEKCKSLINFRREAAKKKFLRSAECGRNMGYDFTINP